VYFDFETGSLWLDVLKTAGRRDSEALLLKAAAL
jgi:hypothetical protein